MLSKMLFKPLSQWETLEDEGWNKRQIILLPRRNIHQEEKCYVGTRQLLCSYCLMLQKGRSCQAELLGSSLLPGSTESILSTRLFWGSWTKTVQNTRKGRKSPVKWEVSLAGAPKKHTVNLSCSAVSFLSHCRRAVSFSARTLVSLFSKCWLQFQDLEPSVLSQKIQMRTCP